MEEVLGIILLLVTIIVSLPIVGFMIFCGLLWFADWRQERKFKKYQKEGLSKEGLEEWRKRRIQKMVGILMT